MNIPGLFQGPIVQQFNAFNQPIGSALPDWVPAGQPTTRPMIGQYCRLEPLDPPRHAAALFEAYAQAPDDRDWTYMTMGPFHTLQDYLAWASAVVQDATQQHYAIIDQLSDVPLGTLALLRITPTHGCIEIGSVMLSPAVQRTRIATEAHYLVMNHVFQLGYRRYEWKCDSNNEASRRAAIRLGFTHEGTFRQALVYKGRSRDTAWFAMIDQDWPVIQPGFQRWLAPENFDTHGDQLTRLNINAHRSAEPAEYS